MRAALDRVLAAAPGDAGATRYRAILDRGEAEPDTPDLALVLLTHYVRTDRLPEAAREAEKVLAKFPKHWQARCTLAHHALAVRKDPARAAELLEQLPDPEDPAAAVSLGGVLHAVKLSGLVGRDSGPLRRLIVRRLLPYMRGAAASAPAGAKVQLVACYLEPFADADALGELAPFWAAADKLADDAVNEAAAAGDVAVLTQLAELGPRMRGALGALHAHDSTRLPDDRFRALLTAVDDRTRRAWQAVREKQPAGTGPYLGLARLALQAGDPNAAVRELVGGLAACGDRNELLAALLAVAERFGTPDEVRPVAESLWNAAGAAKDDPEKWCLAARGLIAADRADRAMEACAMARAVRPDYPPARAIEAAVWVRAGEFFRAREALAPLGEAVRTDPALVRLHARVLVGSGLWVTLDDEFQKVREQSKSRGAVAFLLGVHDAPPDAARAAWVAAKAEFVPANDPAATLAARLRAESLYRLADLSAAPHPKGGGLPPVWDAGRVAAALRAFEQLPLAERLDAEVIASVATLQVKGQGNAAAALRTAEALLARETALGAAHLEVAGAVLLANDRAADAVRVLERAAKMPKASAGCRVALALAYHRTGQADRRRDALIAAERAPGRTDREHAELVAAKLLFAREKS
jgi:predicted Zn-dependent protease